MNRGARPIRHTATATISGSISLWWFTARTNAPVRGSFSAPTISMRAISPTSGTTMPASGQNTLGRVFSVDARGRFLLRRTLSPGRRSRRPAR
jgi:hypothetical protein